MLLQKKLKLTAAGMAAISMSLLSGTANANDVGSETLISDDLYVTGSACIGIDCVNGSAFGFDTIKLRENNLRIKFEDTSASASFPSNDWELTANDSSNGGANRFSITDVTGGRTPFTVEAAAPTDSLRIDDGGRIGFGTGTPVVELHVVDGDSPTLRLEQDGSSGFTPQTWDLAGNETNFFLRDVTNGSRLPFRSRPGAPTSSIDINGSGNVGFGTTNPLASIHVSRSDDTANFLVYDTAAASASRDMFSGFKNGGPSVGLWDTSVDNYWRMTGGGSFQILEGSGLGGGFTDLFNLTTSGNLTIPGSITTGGGMCGGGCDAVFEPDYDMPTIEAHAEAMFENKYLPNVGPTIENEPINVSDKLGRMLNELEKAHIYIADINEQNKVMAAENEALKARLEKIEQQLQ